MMKTGCFDKNTAMSTAQTSACCFRPVLDAADVLVASVPALRVRITAAGA